MSVTPRQSLSEAYTRAGRSPMAASPNRPNPNSLPFPSLTYTSFPTHQQMQRDRIESRDDGKVRTAAHGKRSCCVSVMTFVGSAPALLHMCCWPTLIAAIFGGTVTAGSRHLSHTLSLIFTAIALTLLMIYIGYCTRERSRRYSSGVQVYGPFVLLCFASMLVLADPLRHVLQDSGLWTGPSSKSYYDGCSESWNCWTATGILFMGVFTYLGFVLLFTANLWNANFIERAREFIHRQRVKRAERAAANHAAKEAKLAAAVEAERARAAAAQAERPSTLSFGALHLSMKPPAIFFRSEPTNSVGYRVTNKKPMDEGLPPNLDANIKMAGEYRREGYSYEVKGVTENVIKVGGNMNSLRPQSSPPRGASPTLTSSPSSSSNDANRPSWNVVSPLSTVALTPPNAINPIDTKEFKSKDTLVADNKVSSPGARQAKLHYQSVNLEGEIY